MAKKESAEQKLMHKWWVLVALGLGFIGLAYGFVSLAIDTGSLWQYAVGVIFLIWAVRYLIKGIRQALHR